MCQQSLASSISKAENRATTEQGKANQLCVFILGRLYLGVLKLCLGMGVRYTYSSLVALNTGVKDLFLDETFLGLCLFCMNCSCKGCRTDELCTGWAELLFHALMWKIVMDGVWCMNELFMNCTCSLYVKDEGLLQEQQADGLCILHTYWFYTCTEIDYSWMISDRTRKSTARSLLP